MQRLGEVEVVFPLFTSSFSLLLMSLVVADDVVFFCLTGFAWIACFIKKQTDLCIHAAMQLNLQASDQCVYIILYECTV
eukprot:m.250763 g.250763  ORF g.250763 m.250763 type:complete len:79 (+) comp17179_c0_seq18:41-277(+)